MATQDKAKSALPYLQRLLEDEYVHEQLREAAVGLRNAYGRAATALRKPEPPPKRRARKLLIFGLAAGGAALLTRLGRRQQDAGASASTSAASAVPSAGNGPVQMETAATSS
jgi:hypothetical protein